MPFEVTGLPQVLRIINNLSSWARAGSKQDIDQGARDIARAARRAVEGGLNADGTPMTPLAKATLEGPIRRQGDSRIRGGSGSVPMNATGKTAASISSKKTGSDKWEISSDTEKGDMILSSNAKRSHSGAPFAGDVRKPVRDPLQVTDKQLDILEDALFKGIERAIGNA